MLDTFSGCWMGVGCITRVLDGVLDVLLSVGWIFRVLDGVLDALFSSLFYPTLLVGVGWVLDGCWVSQYQNQDNFVFGRCWMVLDRQISK